MDLVFAYLAGLLTLINPCVLPVVPIVAASSLQAGRAGPLALVAGMSLSFVTLGVGVAALGPAIGLNADQIARAGAILMFAMGLVLLTPPLARGFERATSGLAARADAGASGLDGSGMNGQFALGLLLGAVWSPCTGPTLGGAIALASLGQGLVRAGAVMLAFALGVSTLMLAMSTAFRRGLAARLRHAAPRIRPLTGLILSATGLSLALGLHHKAEAWLIGIMPDWLLTLSVSI
jgi:cytochrome c-type biogenesis protein